MTIVTTAAPAVEPAQAAPPRVAWTVQCGFASYDANTVVVEAATPEEACERAIELANQSDGWKRLDHCSDTFVDALARGEDVDPWAGGVRSAEVVPDRFTEAGEPPEVTVVCVDGRPHHARRKGRPVRLLVQRDGPTSAPEPLDPVLVQLPAA